MYLPSSHMHHKIVRHPPSYHPFYTKNHYNSHHLSPISHPHLDQESVLDLVQFLVLNDPNVDIQKLEPLSPDFLPDVLLDFPNLSSYCTNNQNNLSIILILQVDQYVFLLTIGYADEYFDIFYQTGLLLDFKQLDVHHISSQPIILWMFKKPSKSLHLDSFFVD